MHASFSLCLALALACSDGGSGASPDDGSPVAAAGAAGVAGAGGSAQSGGMPPAAAGAGGSAGTGAPAFAQVGVCGQRGQSPVTVSSFEGYEEYYLIGEDGFGKDICVVHFDVSRVGAAPPGCDGCAWSHRVAYRNPEVLTDVDGVCAMSELGMSASKIAEVDGSEVAYGYVYEYAGHVSVLMKYDEAAGTWGPNGNASWDEQRGMLRFDRRNGFCGY